MSWGRKPRGDFDHRSQGSAWQPESTYNDRRRQQRAEERRSGGRRGQR